MRFMITLVMPSRNNALVHQVIAEHAAGSLDDFYEDVSASDFILVDEYYVQGPDNQHHDTWYENRGPLVINTHWIGKVKEFKPHPPRAGY